MGGSCCHSSAVCCASPAFPCGSGRMCSPSSWLRQILPLCFDPMLFCLFWILALSQSPFVPVFSHSTSLFLSVLRVIPFKKRKCSLNFSSSRALMLLSTLSHFSIFEDSSYPASSLIHCTSHCSLALTSSLQLNHFY